MIFATIQAMRRHPKLLRLIWKIECRRHKDDKTCPTACRLCGAKMPSSLCWSCAQLIEYPKVGA